MVCPCIKNAPSTAAPSSRDTCIRRQSKYHYTNKYKMSITKKRSKKKNYDGMRSCLPGLTLLYWLTTVPAAFNLKKKQKKNLNLHLLYSA